MPRIVLVEPDVMLRESLAELLRSKGHDVACAATHNEAYALMRTHRPEVLVLDIDLSTPEALQTLDRLNSGSESAAILVVTNVRNPAQIAALAARRIRHVLARESFAVDRFVQKLEACAGRSVGLAGVADAARAKAAEVAPAGVVADACPALAQAPAAAVPVVAKPTSKPAVIAEVSTKGAQAAPALVLRGVPAPAVPAVERPALAARPALLTKDKVEHALAKAGELHALSPAVTRVLDVASRPDASADDVAKIIRQDPGIAVKVLRIANSAVYTRGAPVDNVLTAVRRIGLEQIRQTVLNIGVVQQMSQAGAGVLDHRLFWEHSLAVGLIAAEIVRSTNGKPAAIDAAFTCGLLHDVGRLLLANALGETYGMVIQTARETFVPLDAAEKHLLGVTHTDVLARLLGAWKFAESMAKPIMLHHAGPRHWKPAGPECAHMCEVLAMADRLTHLLLIGDSGNDAVQSVSESAASLGVKPEFVRAVQGLVTEQVQDLKVAMLARASGEEWPCAVADLRRRLPAEVRLRSGDRSDAWNPWQIIAGRVSDNAATGPIVAIISTPPDDGLKARLAALDDEGGSPSAVIGVGDGADTVRALAAERRVAIVPAPTLGGLAAGVRACVPAEQEQPA